MAAADLPVPVGASPAAVSAESRRQPPRRPLVPLLLPLPILQCPHGTTPFHPFPLKALLRLPFLPRPTASTHTTQHASFPSHKTPPAPPLSAAATHSTPSRPRGPSTMPHLFQDHAHFLPHSPQPCPFPGPPLLARPLAAPLSRHNPAPIPPPRLQRSPLTRGSSPRPAHSQHRQLQRRQVALGAVQTQHSGRGPAELPAPAA